MRLGNGLTVLVSKIPTVLGGPGAPCTIPGLISNFNDGTVTDTTIELTWDDLAGDETFYLIERSDDNIIFSQIASVPAGTLTYTDTGLTASTTYYYRMRATAPCGTGPYTPVALIVTTTSGLGIGSLVIGTAVIG